jgi:photosystem II stability/assembly factor-like uncharacterized protein
MHLKPISISILFLQILLTVPLLAAGDWSVQDSMVTRLTDVFFCDPANGWILTETDTVYRTTDGGKSWTITTTGSKYALSAAFFSDPLTGWAAGDLGTILKTGDGGISWQPQSSTIFDLLVSIHFIDEHNGWAVGEAGTLVHTLDSGAHWKSSVVPNDSTEHQCVFFLDALHGWVAGGLDEAAHIMRTLDGGISWSTVLHDTSYGPLRCVQFVDENTGWAAGMAGVILKTEDSGNTWSRQLIFTDGEQVRDLRFLDKNTGWVIGIKKKILYTENGGATWDSLTPPVAKPLTDLWFTDPDHGWAITSAGGTSESSTSGESSDSSGSGSKGRASSSRMSYIIAYSPATGIRASEWPNISNDFSLHANYPNPFNPSTTISYHIGGISPVPVTVAIYSTTGQLVRILVDRVENSGTHQIQWDGCDPYGKRAASGVYFFQLQAGPFNERKKMTLLY